METYKNQETSTLYTRAQMIEFGEKVREECSDKSRVKTCSNQGYDYTANMEFALHRQKGYTVYPDQQSILSINIENLLNK